MGTIVGGGSWFLLIDATINGFSVLLYKFYLKIEDKQITLKTVKLLVFLSLCFISGLYAQAPVQHVFQHVNRNEGFPAHYVYELMQDQKGYIWMGIDNGLVRYDGQSFVFFKSESSGKGSNLADGQVVRMYADSKGNIWFFTYSKSYLLSVVRTATRKVYDCWENGHRLEAFGCYELAGNFYVLTKAGIQSFDRSTFKLGEILIDKSFASGSDSHIFNGIDRKGRLWGWGQKGLFCYDPFQKKLFHRQNNPYHWPILEVKERPNKMYWEKNEDCWFSCVNGNFYHFDFHTKQVFFKEGATYIDHIQSGRLWSISGDEAGNIWLSGEFGKICRYFINQDSFACIQESYTDHTTLAGTEMIVASMVDREGNMWVEVNGGVDFFNPARQQISTYRFNKQGKIGHAPINGFVELPSGDILISRQDFGINWYDASFALKKTFKWDPNKVQTFPFQQVHAIHPIGNKKIVVTGEMGQIGVLDLAFGQINLAFCEPCWGRPIHQIYRGPNGDLWMSSYAASVLSWSAQQQQLGSFDFIAENYAVPGGDFWDASCFLEDGKDRMWIGTRGDGIIHYDVQYKRIIKKYHYRKDSLDESTHNYVYKIVPWGRDSLLIGTANGLKFIDKKREIFAQSNLKNLTGKVEAMEWDNGGRLWLTSIGKLYVTDQKLSFLRLFDQSNGLLHETYRFTSYSLYKLKDGRFLLGTDIGNLMVFDPNLLFNTKNTLFKPVITECKVDNAFFPIDSFIDNQLPIVLPFHRNSISISYASLTYDNPNIAYQYRIKQTGETWTNTGKNRTINFLKLPSGRYTFQIRAYLPDGMTTVPLSFTIIIQAPWFQQTWFYVAVLCILGMSVFLFVRSRIKKLKLRESQQRRIADLENQALRAQINPHFIFNAIQSIKKFVLISDVDQAEQYLSRFAKLIRLIMDNSRQATVPLSQELELLELYLQLEQLRHGHKFDYHFEIEPDILSEDLEVPSMVLQPFIENAVLHGLAHLKNRRGKIRLYFKRQGENLWIDIEDNGVGRVKADELKSQLFRQHHISRGLEITRRRLAIFSESSKKVAGFQILDLFDAQGQSKGTKVEVWIPIDS